jgi:hypothetical protein
MNTPREISYRLRLMLAIKSAQDGGLFHFADTLAEMLREEVRDYSFQTFDRMLERQTKTSVASPDKLAGV